MSAARGRVDAGEYARRVNAAAELLASRVALAEAARLLAARFGCSARQALRYVERAAQDGPTAWSPVCYRKRSPSRRRRKRARHTPLAGGTPPAITHDVSRGPRGRPCWHAWDARARSAART